MRLLTPIQNKDAKDQQNLRDIIRKKELDKASQKSREDLAKSQQDFQTTLAKNREQWATEEQEHEQRVKERKTEIDVLEAKRINALIPVRVIEQSAEERLQEATEFMAKLREREEYVDDLTEKLQDKLDETGQKEQDLSHKEKELNIREEGVERQSQNTILNSQKLSEQIEEFSNYKHASIEAIKDKEKVIKLEQDVIEQKFNNLNSLEKELNDRAIRLADERGTLDRAWKELDRRKIKLNIPIEK